VSGRDQVLEALKEECASLSVEELAEVAGLPAWRVRAMAKQGKGPPHFRIGKLYRFPVTGVRAWFKEQTDSQSEK
jgi:excisionase family DNA binding protein